MPGRYDVGGALDRPLAEARRLLERHRRTAVPADLEDAERLLRRALAAAPAGDPNRSDAIATLAEMVVQRVRTTGERGGMDEAVDLARVAADLLPRDSSFWAGTRAHLAWVLCQRYEETGRVSDLEEALRHIGPALAVLGDEPNPDRAGVLRTAAYLRHLRYSRHGALADLDEAVRLARLAVPASLDPTDSWASRATLGVSLSLRFGPVGDRADIDEAAGLFREMLSEMPATHVERVVVLAGLAHVLWQRFLRYHEMGDLAEATEASRLMVAALPPSARMRELFLANHAAVLLGRLLTEEAPDLTEAVRAAQLAVEASGVDGPRLGINRSNLANILLVRARSVGDPAGVEEAVATGRAALAALSPGNPDRSRVLGVLADALRVRHMITKDPGDLADASGLWRAAVGSRVGPIEVRMTAATNWARTAANAGDAALAVEAFTAAIGLLPVYAWRGLDRTVQEQRLKHVAGLGSDAAAWALTAGEPRRAVELLEQGRQVLWSQALQTRGDLSALAAAAPDLAARLDEARRGLDAGASPPDLGGGAGGELRVDLVGAFGGGMDTTDRRRRLAERWEALLAEARRLPGFGDFLSAPPFARLCGAASGGPVVLVNSTRWRGDALVVTGTDVHPVPLPWLDHDAAQQRAAALLAAQREAESTGAGPARAHWRHTLVSTLRWLWDVVAEPVCAALSDLVARDPDDPAARPRVWWCPTGPLTMLPLHAAGRYGASPGMAARRRPSVPARFVSSYTPSLDALLRARSRPAPGGPPRVFAVGLTRTPGQAPLPEVADELRAISTHLRGVRLLTGPAATRAAVLDALGRHAWAHFACHAVQSVERPTESALHLVDGRLSVLDLATGPALAGSGLELAYLSACRTAAGVEDLPDEGIHLTAALQMAGYRHVIGSQWAVADRIAARVADDVYRTLAGGAGPAGPAGALAAALDGVRRDRPDRPELWASLVHTGP